MDDFSKWKVAELKAELKNLGLPFDGKKADLVARLTQHHQGPAQAPEVMPGDEEPGPRSSGLGGEEIPADPDIPGQENGDDDDEDPEDDAPLEEPVPEPHQEMDEQPTDPAAEHNGTTHDPAQEYEHHLDDPHQATQHQEWGGDAEESKEAEGEGKEEDKGEENIPTDLRVVKIMGFLPNAGEEDILRFLHDVKTLDVRFYGEGTSREAFVELLNGPGGNFAKAMAHHEDDLDSQYIIVRSSSIRERDNKCPEPAELTEPEDSGLTLRLQGFPNSTTKANVLSFLQGGGVKVCPEEMEEFEFGIPSKLADRVLMPSENGSARRGSAIYVKVADGSAASAALGLSGRRCGEAEIQVEKAEDVDMAIASTDFDWWHLDRVASTTGFIERALNPRPPRKRKLERDGSEVKSEKSEEGKAEVKEEAGDENQEPDTKRVKTEDGSSEGAEGSGSPAAESKEASSEPNEWRPNHKYFPPAGKSARYFGVGAKDPSFEWQPDRVPDFWMTNLEKEAIARDQRRAQNGGHAVPLGRIGFPGRGGGMSNSRGSYRGGYGGGRGDSNFEPRGPRPPFEPRGRGGFRGGFNRFERPPFQGGSPRFGPRDGPPGQDGPRPPFRRWNDESCVFLVDVPFRTHWKEIKDWFLPLVATRVFIIKLPDGRDTGEVNVEFETPQMANEAVCKSGQMLGNRRVSIGLGRSPSTPSYGGGPGSGSIPGRVIGPPPGAFPPGGGPPGRGGYGGYGGYGGPPRGGGPPHGYAQPAGHGTYRASAPPGGAPTPQQQAEWASQWAQWQQSQASYAQQQQPQHQQPTPTSNPTPEQQAEYAAKWAEWQRSQQAQQAQQQTQQQQPPQPQSGESGGDQADYAAKWAEWQRSQQGGTTGGAQQQQQQGTPQAPPQPQGYDSSKAGDSEYNAQWQQYYQQYYQYQQQMQQWQQYYGSGQSKAAAAAGAQAAQAGQAASQASHYSASGYVPPPPPN